MDKKAYKFYIGIDISKTNLDVALSTTETLMQFSNNEAGLKDLLKILQHSTGQK